MSEDRPRSGAPDDARLAQLARLGLGGEADAALDRVAALVCDLLQVPVALVSLVDEERQVFPGQRGLGEVRQTPLSHSFCQHVVRSGEPLVVDDARSHPLVKENPAVDDLSVVAYAGHPITDAQGRVLGSLCAIASEPRAWSAADLDRLRSLAEGCSAELRVRLAARDTDAALSRLSVLAEATRAISTTLDPQELVQRLARTVVPVLAGWAVAGLSDETGQLVHDCAHPREEAGDQGVPFAQHVARASAPTALARRLLHSGEAVRRTADDGPLCGLASCQDALCLVRSADDVLVVPLRGRAGNQGFLMLGRSAETHGLDGDAVLTDAVDIGRRAGLALDNAGLYQRSLGQAEQLQRQLLTLLPEPEQLHVVARYRPADDEAQVGGDWYDAFLQRDGALVAVVGDATGHDMRAAALMGQVRTLVRGIGYDTGAAPAELLRRVDRGMQGLGIDTLATTVVVRVEQDEGSLEQDGRLLRWSNAGHPPPVLIGDDGTVTLLETDGELLLGLDPEVARTDHTVVLPTDSVLLLYTDGLIERRGEALDRGLARLRQTVAALTGLGLDELCDGLLDRMLPDGSDDDVALLAVRAYSQAFPHPQVAGPAAPPAPSSAASSSPR